MLIEYIESPGRPWWQCLHHNKGSFGLILNFHLKRSHGNADVVIFVCLVKIFVMRVPANVVTPNKLCKVLRDAVLVWPFQCTVIVFQHFPHRLVWLPTEGEVTNKPINMQNIEQSCSAHSHQPKARRAGGCSQDRDSSLLACSALHVHSPYLPNRSSAVCWSKEVITRVSAEWLMQ